MLQAGSLCSPEKDASLRSSQPHAVKQSPPLKPAQSNHAKQTTRDGRRLRNGRAIYLDVIDLVLEIDAIGLSPGECQSQDGRWVTESRSARNGESQDCSGTIRDYLGGAELGKRRSSIAADQK